MHLVHLRHSGGLDGLQGQFLACWSVLERCIRCLNCSRRCWALHGDWTIYIWELAMMTIIIVIIVLILIIEVIHNIRFLFRCGAISSRCTRCWVVETTMGDLKRLITEKLCTGTQASWANKTSLKCRPTNLQGFYVSFMISSSLASICHPYQLIEATLMCMVQSITIRYGSCCICSPVSNMLVIVIFVICLIIVIIVINGIWVVVNCMHIYTILMHQAYCLWSSGKARHQWWCCPVFELHWQQ